MFLFLENRILNQSEMYPKNHLMSKRYKTSEGAKSKRVGMPGDWQERIEDSEHKQKRSKRPA